MSTKLDDEWTVTAGVKHVLSRDPLTVTNNGRRTDVGAKLSYKYDDDSSAYIFGQVTAHRTGALLRNDRFGVGGTVKLTEKVGLESEASYGTTGWGGLVAVTYDPTVDDHYYLGYRLDPDRSALGTSALYGTDLGTVVSGC